MNKVQIKNKVCLFDLDGTLINSMPYFINGMLKVLDEKGIKYPSNIVQIITPLGYEGTAKYFINNLGIKEPIEKLVKIMVGILAEKYQKEIPLKDGVYEFTKSLKEKGYKLYVLTASPHIMLDSSLQRLGVLNLFEKVWSCDDFSTTKADVNIYKMVAKEIGVNVEDIAFFDDNINSIKTGKKAGCYTIGVYDISGESFKQELSEIADYYVNNFLEIINEI